MVTHGSKGKPSELKVVFDTSVLFTGSASDLLRQDAVELIKQNSDHSDLLLTWYLPEVVLHERLYQMHSAALGLLPSLQKLERLLGHQLNITEDIVKQRANEAAEKWCQDLRLQKVPLVVAAVDWERLTMDATYRRLPFQPGDKEKGFRDALIAETFVQLVAASPSTPKVCRLAFVAGDGHLSEAVRARVSANQNVRILTSLEELKGLISTLISAVSEEFVAGIQEAAKDYFFKPKDNECLLIKEKIRERIRQEFGDILNSVPEGADRREHGTWWVAPPRFVKKQGQRVFWATRITVEAEAYKAGQAPSSNPFLDFLMRTALTSPPPPPSGMGPLSPPSTTGFLSSPSQQPAVPEEESRDTLVAKGNSKFEVTWSVIVTTTRKFTHPRIDKLAHVETTWGK